MGGFAVKRSGVPVSAHIQAGIAAVQESQIPFALQQMLHVGYSRDHLMLFFKEPYL